MVHTFRLTDTVDSLEIPEWEITSAALDIATPHPFSVRKRTLHGGRQEGSTLIEVTAGDFAVVLSPTRGMGVMSARCGQTVHGWSSPVDEVVHPAFMRLGERGGLGWLEGFNELMVRCGYEWNGHPAREGERVFTLHGRAGNIPASRVTVEIESEAPHRIRVKGLLKEKAFKFVDFEVETCLTVTPGQSGFAIDDRLTNRGDYDKPYQALYHTNFGRPLLEEGARIVAPFKRVAPFNERAKQGLAAWDTYLGPTRDFDEEVFACEMLAGADHRTLAALVNKAGDAGVAVRFDVRGLPVFTLWKNTDTEKQGYVTGLEPGTSYPYARPVQEKLKRLPTLAAGASVDFAMAVEFLSTKAAVDAVAAESAAIAAGRSPTVKSKPVFAPKA
jgi:hypothetical protein